MSTDDILFDTETAFVKKGETYLFSDSYLALKHKSKLHSKLKYGEHPFAFKNEYGEITNTTFLCRIQ